MVAQDILKTSKLVPWRLALVVRIASSALGLLGQGAQLHAMDITLAIVWCPVSL
jgi:hypothetical protein